MLAPRKTKKIFNFSHNSYEFLGQLINDFCWLLCLEYTFLKSYIKLDDSSSFSSSGKELNLGKWYARHLSNNFGAKSQSTSKVIQVVSEVGRSCYLTRKCYVMLVVDIIRRLSRMTSMTSLYCGRVGALGGSSPTRILVDKRG